jgi:hypothetical protein
MVVGAPHDPPLAGRLDARACQDEGSMRRVVVTTVAVLVAVLGATVAAAGGAPRATPDGKLLARYAPVLVLHPEEPFLPVPVDGFLADSDLQEPAADGTWAPFPGALADAPATARLDQRLCRAIDGPAASECYAAAEAAHGARPTAYGAVFRTRTRLALQYWLFYPFNPWSSRVPPGEFWQTHEGDWEAVTVILDAAEQPTLAGLSRHSCGVRRLWANAPKRGKRLLVYVSVGSHANGFRAGSIPLDRRCTPPELVAIFAAYGEPLVDHAAAGRAVVPAVVRVTAAVPAWMRFRGRWGEDEYGGLPGNAPLRIGTGPKGPLGHELWRKPFAVPLSWPKG